MELELNMNKKIIGFFLLFLVSTSLFAGIRFTPIQLYIQDFKKQKSTTISVESSGVASSKIFEINAFKWTQDEQGEDILVEDNTLLFNPKTFELKPESKQLVRIGFSQPPLHLKKQESWRVVFKEVTPIENKSNINFLFNFSLPLFAGEQLPPQLDIKLEKTNNSAYLNIDNTAKSHAKITEVVVLDNKNKEVFKKDLTLYILSGNKIRYNLGDFKNNNSELKLKVKVEEYGYLEFPVKG